MVQSVEDGRPRAECRRTRWFDPKLELRLAGFFFVLVDPLGDLEKPEKKKKKGEMKGEEGEEKKREREK